MRRLTTSDRNSKMLADVESIHLAAIFGGVKVLLPRTSWSFTRCRAVHGKLPGYAPFLFLSSLLRVGIAPR